LLERELEDFLLEEEELDVVFLAAVVVVVFAGATLLDLAVVFDCAPAFMATAIANTATDNFR
jgi:hypothetical protein